MCNNVSLFLIYLTKKVYQIWLIYIKYLYLCITNLCDT